MAAFGVTAEDGSRLQDRNRLSSQTVPHVLDGPRSQRHHCPAMLPHQQPFRGLLGGAPSGGLISTSTSHTRAACGTDDRFMSSVNQPNSSWPRRQTIKSDGLSYLNLLLYKKSSP